MNFSIGFPYTTECSWGMYMFSTMFFLFIVSWYWNKYNTKRYLKKKIDYGFLSLIILYILTAFYNGDYWHYLLYVFKLDMRYAPSEEIYDKIVALAGENYMFFRLIVWGGALMLFIKTAQCCKLNVNSSLYFLFAMYIGVFDYARATLAMAVYFCGFAMLTTSTKVNLIKIISSLLIICLSYTFHTSMSVVIAMTIIIFIPLNKKMLLIMLIAIPMLMSILNVLLSVFLGYNLETMASVYEKIEEYQSFETIREYSFLENVRLTWLYCTFFVPFIFSTYIMFFKNKFEQFPFYVKSFYKIIFAIIMLAVSTKSMGFNNNVLFYRYLYISMIPLTLLVCYLRESGYISFSMYRKILFLGIYHMCFRQAKVLLKWTGPIK